jgi:hypothetical protein
MTVRFSAPSPRRNNTSKSRTAATAMMTQTHGSIVRSLPSLIDRCLPEEAPRHTPGEVDEDDVDEAIDADRDETVRCVS